jgi:hypothetical protein
MLRQDLLRRTIRPHARGDDKPHDGGVRLSVVRRLLHVRLACDESDSFVLGHVRTIGKRWLEWSIEG